MKAKCSSSNFCRSGTIEFAKSTLLSSTPSVTSVTLVAMAVAFALSSDNLDKNEVALKINGDSTSSLSDLFALECLFFGV